MGFSKQFYWGAATASYQIEGACREDGKTDSIWDIFSHKKGTVLRNDNGDIACDHYHRAEEDLDYLKELGVNAYRFSLSWSRLLPNGTGKINQAGAEFYHRLIDGLLERGITPFLTLYHWDLPQTLQARGGFQNPEIADWFEEYAEAAKKLYGDKVKRYFTINEPQCVLDIGYREGRHAPGLRLSVKEQLYALHNLLLAHGKAARVLKSIRGAEVGYASAGTFYAPASEKEEDLNAAYERSFACDREKPLWSVSAYADPIYLGKYPRGWYEFPEELRPEITEEEMKLISTPIDFFGLNLYDGKFVKRGADGTVEELPFQVGAPKTLMGWEITPSLLYWAPVLLQKRYGKKLYISENGISCPDLVFTDGKVHDTYRQEYIKTYLTELKKATENTNVDLAGYFHWSLLDNFEWAEGYCQRFGLIHVDFKTLKRTPKDSFYYYKSVIETNGENL